MSKFKVELYVPEKSFYVGEVDSLTVVTTLGEIGILKNHARVVIGIIPNIIVMKKDNQELICVSSDGFVCVTEEKTMVFAQTMEWPEDIILDKINSELEEGLSIIKNAKNELDKKLGTDLLDRANARLKVYKRINN